MTLRRLVLASLFVALALGTAAQAAPKQTGPATKPATRPSRAQEVARLQARLVELVKAGKYAECEPVLKRLVEINPKDNVSWYNLACVYSRLGRVKEGLAALVAAVKAGWRDVEHMDKDEDLATLRKTREYQVLRALLKRAKSGKPTTGPARRPPTATSRPGIARARELMALRRRVLKHFEAKQFEKARDALHKILEIHPDSATDWYNLACVHSRMSNIPEAIACLAFAVGKGYTSFRHMERDPDLKALRWTKAYRELLARRDAIQRARAEKILAALREKYGSDYICEIDHDRKMVFATNVDRKTLDGLKAHLTRYASAQWRDLFTYPFEEYITIVVPKKWASRRVGGYYNHAARVLMCRSIGMVLTHEFTHAMHFSDMEGLGQRHPIWIIEGFATLFETSKLVDGRVVPEANHRLNQVQGFIRGKRTMPLGDLVKLSHRNFIRRAAIAYAQSRYVMVYLHEKGLLKKWYDAYAASYEDDSTGAKALVKVCGKQLAQIEADWKKWVLAQKPLMLRLPAEHAYVGISVQPFKDGVQVVRVVPGSGADKAGLKVGDVVVRIDSNRMVDPLDLIRVVGTHEVGDKVQVHFRRDGKYQTVAVTLQAMPAELAGRPRRRPTTRPAPRKPTTKPTRRKPTTRPAPRRPAPRKPTSRPARKKPAPPKPKPTKTPTTRPVPKRPRAPKSSHPR